MPTGAAASTTPTMGDASVAAARLLEIASANADQLMEQAKEEADRIVGEARAKAERITNESRGKADRLETDARIRAQKLDDETNERRQQAVATIERERYELQREVEHLRAYEREYRARLKNYFQSQLDQLAANENTNSTSAVQAPADASPRRLRSLLGDEDTRLDLEPHRKTPSRAVTAGGGSFVVVRPWRARSAARGRRRRDRRPTRPR